MVSIFGLAQGEKKQFFALCRSPFRRMRSLCVLVLVFALWSATNNAQTTDATIDTNGTTGTTGIVDTNVCAGKQKSGKPIANVQVLIGLLRMGLR
jgi:hypothetical protein